MTIFLAGENQRALAPQSSRSSTKIYMFTSDIESIPKSVIKLLMVLKTFVERSNLPPPCGSKRLELSLKNTISLLQLIFLYHGFEDAYRRYLNP